jgi:hypothetical protein
MRGAALIRSHLVQGAEHSGDDHRLADSGDLS